MAERTIDYKITAKDEASGVFSRFSRNLQKSMKEAETASGKIIGPTTINRQMLSSTRTTEEQAVRDLMANRIKGMRRAAAEERIRAVAEEKLFGSQLSSAMRQTNQKVAAELTGLAKLKSVLGARGSVKDVAELFVGGGAIAAVGFITHTIANAARNARELTDEFREGKIQAGEFADKLVGTIPVLGSIWRAGRDIREMITGEQMAIREATKQAEAMNAAMQARLEIQRKGNDATQKQLETLRQINREMQTRFMSGSGRDITQAGFASSDARRGAVESAAADIKSIQDSANKAIADLMARRAELNKIVEAGVGMPGPKGASAAERELATLKIDIDLINAQIANIRKGASDQQAKIEENKQKILSGIEKSGAADRRKILIDAGKAQAEEWLKQGVKMLDAGRDVQKRMEEQEQKHQENIRRTRDETFRRYMSQYRAAQQLAEGEFRKTAPGRGTATTQEIRFATRVGSPEDGARRAGLDDLRKAATAAVNTQKIVNDIFRAIQNSTGIGQPAIEVFGNN